MRTSQGTKAIRCKEVFVMDIASLSMAMSTQNTLSDVGVLMLNKSLDTMKDMGENMTKIMESSVTPYLGQNIDYFV
jgi:hypothetical protein